MSASTKIDARYVQEGLVIVERKLFQIADDAAATKDKVLVEKIKNIKESVAGVKDYLSSKLDKKTG